MLFKSSTIEPESLEPRSEEVKGEGRGSLLRAGKVKNFNKLNNIKFCIHRTTGNIPKIPSPMAQRMMKNHTIRALMRILIPTLSELQSSNW